MSPEIFHVSRKYNSSKYFYIKMIMDISLSSTPSSIQHITSTQKSHYFSAPKIRQGFMIFFGFRVLTLLMFWTDGFWWLKQRGTFKLITYRSNPRSFFINLDINFYYNSLRNSQLVILSFADVSELRFARHTVRILYRVRLIFLMFSTQFCLT